MNNTYIIYSADNGYHIGQHRLPPGKECGYEEDVNVPLIIRGPGVPRGVTTDQVTSHTDLVPTIFELIGADSRDDFDGAPVQFDGLNQRQEHVNLEYWGFALAEGKYGFGNGILLSYESLLQTLHELTFVDRSTNHEQYLQSGESHSGRIQLVLLGLVYE